VLGRGDHLPPSSSEVTRVKLYIYIYIYIYIYAPPLGLCDLFCGELYLDLNWIYVTYKEHFILFKCIILIGMNFVVFGK